MGYLKTKDETEYTGLESFVAEMIEAEDMAFYPSNKAMCLDADDEEEDPFQAATTAKFEKHLSEIATLRRQLADIKGENTTLQLSNTENNKTALIELENLYTQQESIMKELLDAKKV